MIGEEGPRTGRGSGCRRPRRRGVVSGEIRLIFFSIAPLSCNGQERGTFSTLVPVDGPYQDAFRCGMAEVSKDSEDVHVHVWPYFDILEGVVWLARPRLIVQGVREWSQDGSLVLLALAGDQPAPLLPITSTLGKLHMSTTRTPDFLLRGCICIPRPSRSQIAGPSMFAIDPVLITSPKPPKETVLLATSPGLQRPSYRMTTVEKLLPIAFGSGATASLARCSPALSTSTFQTGRIAPASHGTPVTSVPLPPQGDI